MITFDTDPARYRHWRLVCDGPVATLTLDVAEEGGLFPGYRLKLNSYDLGVDIELNDAVNRIRFRAHERRHARRECAWEASGLFLFGLSAHWWSRCSPTQTKLAASVGSPAPLYCAFSG